MEVPQGTNEAQDLRHPLPLGILLSPLRAPKRTSLSSHFRLVLVVVKHNYPTLVGGFLAYWSCYRTNLASALTDLPQAA